MSYELFDKYGVDNVKIILLENVNAKSKDELISKEASYIRNLKCINKHIPDRKFDEWYQDNKSILINRSKEHYNNNKEKKLQELSMKVTCICGKYLSKGNKLRHEKSFMHQNYLKSLEEIN
jgi:hypothetical protein